MDFKDNILRFRVRVSNGTYIRSLIRDIGEELGCKAVMIGLHRYKIGRLTLRAEIEKIDEELLFEYPAITLEREGIKNLLNGKHQILQQIPYGSVKKILYRKHMVGIYSVSPIGERKIRVFGKKVTSLIQ